MKTIKVGCMPGKLQVLEVREGETAGELIQRAGLECSNHEIRLDGKVVNLDTDISNGSLCVIMSRIKGNVDCDYVTELNKEDVRCLLDLDEELPTSIEEDFVEVEGGVTIIGNGHSIPYVTVDTESFLSIYSKKERTSITENNVVTGYLARASFDNLNVTPVENTNANIESIINDMIRECEDTREKWLAYAQEENSKIEILNDLLNKISK